MSRRSTALGGACLLIVVLSASRAQLFEPAKPVVAAGLPGVNTIALAPRSVAFERADCELAGLVRDAELQPIAGARVCATCANCEPTAAPPSPCALSDVQGHYRIEKLTPSGFFVTAFADGYLPGLAPRSPLFLAAADRRDDVDIMLRPGGAQLAGLVLDATGGPIAHAFVRATRLDTARFAVETWSDEAGHFSLPVSAGSVQLVASADGYASARSNQIAPASMVKLVLTPGGHIDGHVVAAIGGMAVSGIEVRAIPRDNRGAAFFRSAISDEGGAFEIDGLEPDLYLLIAQGGRYYGQHPEPVALGLAEQAHDREVRVSVAAEVRGRVVIDAGDEPCRGGIVMLGPPNPIEPIPASAPGAVVTPGPQQLTTIGADGFVHFGGLPPGHYYVTVQCLGYTLRTGPRVLDLIDQAVSDLRWEVSAGTRLAVKVVDAAGRSVPGAPFFVKFPRPSATQAVAVMPAASDEHGYYEQAGMPAGHYEVTPTRPEDGPAVGVEIRAGVARVECTLRFAGRSNIFVNVTTRDDVPIDDARVIAWPLEASPSAAGADASAPPIALNATALGQGMYRFGPIPAGRYELQAQDGINPPAAFGNTPSTLFSLGEGESARVRLELDRGGRIEGRVVDDDGSPVPNVWVSAHYEPSPVSGPHHADPFEGMIVPSATKRAMSDPDGRFTLENLSTGPTLYTLRVLQPFGRAAAKEHVRTGDEVAITLAAPGAISGVALDERGLEDRSQPLDRPESSGSIGSL